MALLSPSSGLEGPTPTEGLAVLLSISIAGLAPLQLLGLSTVGLATF